MRPGGILAGLNSPSLSTYLYSTSTYIRPDTLLVNS